MNRRPKLEIVAPAASPEEAAAVVAALERFLRDHGRVGSGFASAEPERNPWQRASLYEGVGRNPSGPSPWGDPHPWG